MFRRIGISGWSWGAGALGAALLWSASPAQAQTTVFIHDRHADFATGTAGNAGQNLLIARDGSLRLINAFDLNADGYPDILINNDQDTYENVPAMIYHHHRGQGLRSLLPAIPQDTPGYQQLQWQQESLQAITFLPTLGGGKSQVVDLNGDGYLDIVVTNFIHGWALDHFPIFIYWGSASGYSAERRTELPSLAARAVAVADLDGDGRLDLVLANYGMEYHASETFHGDQYESWIYWQDDRGFSVENRSVLPTAYALDVAVADLDGDGEPEILVLNGRPRPGLRVLGRGAGEDARHFERVIDLPVPPVRFARGLTQQLLVADWNGDGRPDVLVTGEGTFSRIFWNGPAGLTADHTTDLPTHGALGAATADLDGDGHLDLVIANNHRALEGGQRDHQVASYVYWGHAKGFSEARRTELPTLGATAVALGDVTGDGVPDIVFANGQSNEGYDVPSYVYPGSAQGFHPARRLDLHAFGPVDVQLADFDADGRLDVLLINRQSGTPHGKGFVPAYVYWGNAAGAYSAAAMTRLPANSAYSASAGDLDGDGQADLVLTTHHALEVLYSQAGEYPAAKRVAYPMPFRGMTTTLADFDRDGYLDILVGGLSGAEPSTAIFYGTASGFAEPHFFDPGMEVIASAVGDLDGDGTLDILLSGRADLRVIPLSPEGRPDLARMQVLEVGRQTQRIALADLDGDGFLDLIAAHHRDWVTKRLTAPSAIYWNRAGRLSADHRTELPTLGGHWVTVADLQGAGELSILLSNYHGEWRRDTDLFVYGPDAAGRYGSRRFTLPAASSSAHLAMDFDGDGHTDLLVVNHTGPNILVGSVAKSGVHGHGSYLYHGSAEGLDGRRRSWLPSLGPHKILNAEPGDIARRRPYETFTSAPWAGELAAGRYALLVQADHTPRTAVKVQVRGAGGVWRDLPSAGPMGEAERFAITFEEPVRDFQYRLELHTGGSGAGPVVRAVRLESPGDAAHTGVAPETPEDVARATPFPGMDMPE